MKLMMASKFILFKGIDANRRVKYFLLKKIFHKKNVIFLYNNFFCHLKTMNHETEIHYKIVFQRSFLQFK